MKAGRPSYHIRAKWITVQLPQGAVYFELDQKGNLLAKLGEISTMVQRTPRNFTRHTHPQAPIGSDPPVSEVPSSPSDADVDIFGTLWDFTDVDFDIDMNE
jgi:hypothetical protein